MSAPLKLTDVLLVHDVLGANAIQLRFDHANGEHFNYQWSLRHGLSAYEICVELHKFADRLNADQNKFLDIQSAK